MSRVHYKTRQKQAIIDYFKENVGEHINVHQISHYLKNIGTPVGTSTIYRCIDTLVADGVIRKYNLDGNAGACFQYDGEQHTNDVKNFHFRCSNCGKLYHFECKELDILYEHMMKHKFKIDLLQTVFQGKCEKCLNENNNLD